MRTFSVSEFKANCLHFLDDVARSGKGIVVTKRGKPVATVFHAVEPGEGNLYPQQALKGTAEVLGDIINPPLPPDAWDAEQLAASWCCQGLCCLVK